MGGFGAGLFGSYLKLSIGFRGDFSGNGVGDWHCVVALQVRRGFSDMFNPHLLTLGLLGSFTPQVFGPGCPAGLCSHADSIVLTRGQALDAERRQWVVRTDLLPRVYGGPDIEIARPE